MAEQIELVRLREASCQRLPHPPIDHINLTICQGELVGLIGPDGSMKQTLLDLLIGHLPPISGFRTAQPVTGTETFGYAVGQQCLFDDMSVADNLLWLSNTRRKLVWSMFNEQRLTMQLLKPYGLTLDPSKPVRCLSPFERYALEIVKAIEVFHVRLLIIDNLHRIDLESEQRQLLALTEAFRSKGGAVMVCSILRLKIFQETARTYLLQNGQLVRTYQNAKHTIYRAHSEVCWRDPGPLNLKPMADTPLPGRPEDYVLQIHTGDSIKAAAVSPGEVLGIYADRIFEDADIQRYLLEGRITLWHQGTQLPITDFSDLPCLGLGYFPKQIETILFHSLNYRENVEVFAYRKLCRIPGILSGKLEKYFLAHCVNSDPALCQAPDLTKIRHSTVLQIAIDRYRQQIWKLLFIHIPAFVYNPKEYQMMQDFIAEQENKRTAVVILSRDKQGLSRFSSHVVTL